MHSEEMEHTRIGLLGARAALAALASDPNAVSVVEHTESPSYDHPLQVSPYAGYTKARCDSIGEIMRKSLRQSQAAKNKVQGYGKRLTKKDKLVK